MNFVLQDKTRLQFKHKNTHKRKNAQEHIGLDVAAGTESGIRQPG